MLTSTVLRSLKHKSYLFIVCSKRLEFKCDMCKLTIEDDICFCNNCKKCLHLECAGVEKKSRINAWFNQETVLPAPEELPKSCPDCLKSMRSIVGSNSNTIRIRKSPATIHQKPIGSNVASSSSNANRRNPKSPATIHQNSTGSNVASSSNNNNTLRWMAGYLGTYAKNTLISGMNRILESTIQPAHELSKDAYDDCWDHINTPDHELKKKHNGTFYRCFGCKGNSFGPHYACRNSSCSVHLHEECKSPRKLMMHPFFPKSIFSFSSSPKHGNTVNCNACGMNVKGYLYQSLNEHLHPCCVNLPRQIICGQSEATMVLQPNTTSSCSYCKQATSHIWSYVSLSGTFHLHVPCIIKMLSDLTSSHVIGSTSLLTILHQKIDQVNYNMTEYHFEIAAAADAKKKCEKEFKKKLKYAKIALGAIIASVLGEPTTFIFNCTVTFKS